ncbi:MAG: 16S rRNA (guanine(966)-N(2))-methyltransferase RsmD [Lachnospiraceae bacterium]|nr:16S rRNA (guanine(966)-N(2))-methyltransferase RsmD [Lachnospiraceae bacterium]
MRVIAGTCRSMPLKTPKGEGTRPTTDRIKETLFNILMPYLPGAVFIDVFSGSGGIGIEALSRGASHAYFVEKNAEAATCITENLKFTKLTDDATLLKQDFESALMGIHEKEADIIFADPPYREGYEEKLLAILSKMNYVTNDTMIIIEAQLDTTLDFAESYGFEITREKCYKTNKHIFLRKMEE